MYLIFGGQRYYASGGANDLIATHDDEGHAIQIATDSIGMRAITRKALPEDAKWDDDEYREVEWTQVYSVDSGEVIYESESTPYGTGYKVIELIKESK